MNQMISSIDEEKNEISFCAKEFNDLCDKSINGKNLSKECTKYCPKDCIQFDIQISDIKNSYLERDVDESIEETALVWDNNYPLISYMETRVMTFTDYLCFCGGLFGLRFGSNANSVLTYASNIRNWISLKDKFINAFRILLSMICKIIIIIIFFLNFF
jgi:hypothetical protein